MMLRRLLGVQVHEKPKVSESHNAKDVLLTPKKSEVKKEAAAVKKTGDLLEDRSGLPPLESTDVPALDDALYFKWQSNHTVFPELESLSQKLVEIVAFDDEGDLVDTSAWEKRKISDKDLVDAVIVLDACFKQLLAFDRRELFHEHLTLLHKYVVFFKDCLDKKIARVEAIEEAISSLKLKRTSSMGGGENSDSKLEEFTEAKLNEAVFSVRSILPQSQKSGNKENQRVFKPKQVQSDALFFQRYVDVSKSVLVDNEKLVKEMEKEILEIYAKRKGGHSENERSRRSSSIGS